MAAGSVRQNAVRISALRKVIGNGGMNGASHGVENPPLTISASLTLSSPQRRSVI